MLIPIVGEDKEIYWTIDLDNHMGSYMEISDRVVRIDNYGLYLYNKYREGKGRWRTSCSYPYMYRTIRRPKPNVIFFHRELLGLHKSTLRIVFRNRNSLDYRLCNLWPLSPSRVRKEGNDNARVVCDIAPLLVYNVYKIDDPNYLYFC